MSAPRPRTQSTADQNNSKSDFPGGNTKTLLLLSLKSHIVSTT